MRQREWRTLHIHHTVEALCMGTAMPVLPICSPLSCEVSSTSAPPGAAISIIPFFPLADVTRVLCLCSSTAVSCPVCSCAIADVHRWPACRSSSSNTTSACSAWHLCMPLSLCCGKHFTTTAAVLSLVLQTPPGVSSAAVLQAPCKNCLQDS